MPKPNYIPKAIFDSVEHLKHSQLPSHADPVFAQDFKYAKQFLLSYQHNAETFKSFRREIERYAQYCWFIANKRMIEMRRSDIEDYLLHCQKPPTSWISTKNVPRFKIKNGKRTPNTNWRPFTVFIAKANRKLNETPRRSQYKLSEKGFREIFTILNCYYNFLIQEDISDVNPIIQVKQKSRFYRSTQSKAKIRRVSNLQWQMIIETAEAMAKRDPEKHERTLFIVATLYSMYLRISELTVSERWTPTMNDFEKDHNDHWWFTTVGKGNKERRIAVSQSMLSILSRWRNHLGLSPDLPLPNDTSFLLPKLIGQGGITDTSHIRKIVQNCFDEAILTLKQKRLENDAQELSQATVHWLRHTGISEDVKTRPREHVRDDAGHSSSSITDKYIDINLHERHASAFNKVINSDAITKRVKPSVKKSPLPVERITTLGENGEIEKVVTLKMRLRVENNSKFVRGKSRSMKEIRTFVLCHYDINTIDQDCGDYEITLKYTDYKSLDSQIDDIIYEAESIANSRNGFIEFDVYTFDGGYSWPFVYHCEQGA